MSFEQYNDEVEKELAKVAQAIEADLNSDPETAEAINKRDEEKKLEKDRERFDVYGEADEKEIDLDEAGGDEAIAA